MIVVNGFNTISREAAHSLLNDKQTEGIFEDGSMEIAEFLGFIRQQGLGNIWLSHSSVKFIVPEQYTEGASQERLYQVSWYRL